MTTMKAAVVTQFGTEADVTEVERPTPGQHEALVKLISSGVCHTDLHAMEGDWPVKPQPPFVAGRRVPLRHRESADCASRARASSRLIARRYFLRGYVLS